MGDHTIFCIPDSDVSGTPFSLFVRGYNLPGSPGAVPLSSGSALVTKVYCCC